jgi:hypothetical protein
LMTQKDLERVDILSAISNTTPSVNLQSGFGTRVERVDAIDETEEGGALEPRPARVIRPMRGIGGFRLRERLLGGAAVATAVSSEPQQ